MKSQATSIVLVVTVIALVGGVAWFRSAPAKAPNAADAPNSQETATTSMAPKPVIESDARQPTKPAGEPADEPTATPAMADDPAASGRSENPPTVVSTEQPPASPPAAPVEAKKLPRVVDLGADKCIPCKKLAPILEELKKEYEGRVVVEFIDVWKDPQAGDPYKIKLIPTQVFFDAEGKEIWRHEGFLPKEDFIAKFNEMGVK